MWTLLSLFASPVHAAELPTRFVERDGELWGIEVQVEVAPLGTVWLQLDTGIAHGLYLHGRSVPEVVGRSTAEVSMAGIEAREVSVVVREGAPAKQALHSGPVDLGELRVTHVPERSSPKRAGILGMRPFTSGGTLIVDIIGQRLGRIGGCRG